MSQTVRTQVGTNWTLIASGMVNVTIQHLLLEEYPEDSVEVAVSVSKPEQSEGGHILDLHRTEIGFNNLRPQDRVWAKSQKGMITLGVTPTTHFVADDPHTRVHQGVMFHAGLLNAALADDGNLDLIIQTGANDYPHIIIESACGGDAVLQFYEGAVFTGGDDVPVLNHKRTSDNTWPGGCKSGVTVSEPGTPLLSQFMPGGSRNQASGSAMHFDLEWILKNNTNYLVRLINRSGGSAYGFIGFDAYTHTEIADQ